MLDVRLLAAATGVPDKPRSTKEQVAVVPQRPLTPEQRGLLDEYDGVSSVSRDHHGLGYELPLLRSTDRCPHGGAGECRSTSSELGDHPGERTQVCGSDRVGDCCSVGAEHVRRHVGWSPVDGLACAPHRYLCVLALDTPAWQLADIRFRARAIAQECSPVDADVVCCVGTRARASRLGCSTVRAQREYATTLAHAAEFASVLRTDRTGCNYESAVHRLNNLQVSFLRARAA